MSTFPLRQTSPNFLRNASEGSALDWTEADRSYLLWQRAVLGVVLYTLVVLTVAANTVVLVAMALYRQLHSVFHILFLNLAVVGLLVGLVVMNLFAAIIILQRWPFGEAVCVVWMFCDFAMTLVSIFSLVLIAVDRYWAAQWFLLYMLCSKKKKALVAIVSVWTLMTVLWVPAFMVDRTTNSRPGECFYDLQKNKGFAVAVAVVGYHLSTFIIIYCYIRTYMLARKYNKIGFGTSHGPSTLKSSSETYIGRPKPTLISSGDLVTIHFTNENLKTYELQQDQKQPPNSMLVKSSKENLSGKMFVRKQDSRGTTCTVRVVNVHPPCAMRPSGSNPEFVTFSIPKVRSSSIPTFGAAKDDAKRGSGKVSKSSKGDSKMVLTLPYITGGYLICWLPFQLAFDVNLFWPELIPDWVYAVTYWLSYCHSFVNPILFALYNQDFRKSLGKMRTRITKTKLEN